MFCATCGVNPRRRVLATKSGHRRIRKLLYVKDVFPLFTGLAGPARSFQFVQLVSTPLTCTNVGLAYDNFRILLSPVTYTQQNGSESFTGTKETGPNVVTVPGVVEKQVVPPKIEPEEMVSAAEAFALMRARLKRVGR